MSSNETFSEKEARAIAAQALTYKRPLLSGISAVQSFSVTQDQIKAGNAKRDAVLAQVQDRFKRKARRD